MLSRAAASLNGLINRRVSLRGRVREEEEEGGGPSRRRCKLPLFSLFSNLTSFPFPCNGAVVVDIQRTTPANVQ